VVCGLVFDRGQKLDGQLLKRLAVVHVPEVRQLVRRGAPDPGWRQRVGTPLAIDGAAKDESYVARGSAVAPAVDHARFGHRHRRDALQRQLVELRHAAHGRVDFMEEQDVVGVELNVGVGHRKIVAHLKKM
jgi:hypothetical protein